jgi:hypothetical protein
MVMNVYKLKVIETYDLRECPMCIDPFKPRHGNQKYCYDKCSSKSNLIQQDAAAEKLGFKTRKELRIAKWITCPLCGGRLYLVRSELLWKCGN